MKMNLLKIITAFTVALIFAPVAYSQTDTITKLVLVQDAPIHVEGGSAPNSPGHQLFAEANLTKAGKPFGHLVAYILTADTTNEPNKTNEFRVRYLSFELPGGEIVASGTDLYQVAHSFLKTKSLMASIPILGGTGKYLGARGELRTILNNDGTYTQTLLILK